MASVIVPAFFDNMSRRPSVYLPPPWTTMSARRRSCSLFEIVELAAGTATSGADIATLPSTHDALSGSPSALMTGQTALSGGPRAAETQSLDEKKAAAYTPKSAIASVDYRILVVHENAKCSFTVAWDNGNLGTCFEMVAGPDLHRSQVAFEAHIPAHVQREFPQKSTCRGNDGYPKFRRLSYWTYCDATIGLVRLTIPANGGERQRMDVIMTSGFFGLRNYKNDFRE